METENKNDIFNDENRKIFGAVGKDLTNVYMNMLKHLNRYHRWVCYIPKWGDNNKWIDNVKVDVTEVNGVINNREAEKNLNMKSGELGDKQYRLVYRLFDMQLKQYLGYGFAEDRKDFFKNYIDNIRQAVALRKLKTGCDTIIT